MPSDTCSHIRLLCPLFIPGNRADMLAKASRYDASAYVPDFEDSVPAANKDEAVMATKDAMPELVAIGKPVIPRVNSLATGRTEAELEAVVGTGISAISVGKVNSADDGGGGFQPWEYACCAYRNVAFGFDSRHQIANLRYIVCGVDLANAYR